MFIFMFAELRIICLMGKSLAAIAAFEDVFGAIA